MIRDSSTAKANLAGSSRQPEPISATKAGMKMTNTAVIAISIGRNTACTSSAKRRASSIPPSPWRRWLNKGTKPWLKAPSPNRRRNRLGMRKAKAKASAAMPAPITRAKIISRAKPRIRLTMVRPPIVPVAFQRFMALPRGRLKGQAWPISPAGAPSPASWVARAT